MHYILVHGSWHGKWCWSKLSPLLEAKGHTVACIDLPGSGERFEGAEKVTFNHMQDALREEINKASKPLNLVVHSFAGLLAAPLAEELSEKVNHTFYIASWLPREGCSLVDMAVGYNNSELPKIFIDSGNPGLKAIDAVKAKGLFYHDCSKEDQEWASLRLKPKPSQPDYEKMKELPRDHSLGKSTYVLCSIDRVVNPLSQKDMAERYGFKKEQIVTLTTGHSPFLSRPDLLGEILDQVR
jgi:pimeloyl-ACP methyl ester carboxylesterase